MLGNIWFNEFTNKEPDLCNLSTGASPEEDVVTDILTAKEKGVQGDQTKGFSDTLAKTNFKSFNTLKSKRIAAKDKKIMLKADNLFGIMIFISQRRNLNMKDVLSHPLGLVPWSLATGDGTLHKTNKAVLSNNHEKESAPSQEILENLACIIDAMSLVQKIKGKHKTFKEVAETIFRKIV